MNGLIRRRNRGGHKRDEWNTLTTQFLSDLWKDFDSMFDFPTDITCNVGSRFGYPRMNLRNDEKEYVIEAGIPGLSKEDINVDYSEGVLTITGSNQNSSEVNEDDYYVRELHKSAFSRSVRVDEDHCNVEHIAAEVKDGILTVKIPKKVLDKPPNKRIIEVS